MIVIGVPYFQGERCGAAGCDIGVSWLGAMLKLLDWVVCLGAMAGRYWCQAWACLAAMAGWDEYYSSGIAGCHVGGESLVLFGVYASASRGSYFSVGAGDCRISTSLGGVAQRYR